MTFPIARAYYELKFLNFMAPESKLHCLSITTHTIAQIPSNQKPCVASAPKLSLSYSVLQPTETSWSIRAVKQKQSVS